VEQIKTGLAAIARDDARLVILGSLPGDRSLLAKSYYAHPTNQFWRLLGSAIGEDLQSLDYAERLDRLADRGIGLWDVIGSARRSGSLDQAIREAAHNALGDWLATFPQLQAVAFNGRKAAETGRRALAALSRPVTLIDLPSSSAAFTVPLADKARAWAVLDAYCRPRSPPPR
jgi:double-stranded uracil-DNA glycosylase